MIRFRRLLRFGVTVRSSECRDRRDRDVYEVLQILDNRARHIKSAPMRSSFKQEIGRLFNYRPSRSSQPYGLVGPKVFKILECAVRFVEGNDIRLIICETV